MHGLHLTADLSDCHPAAALMTDPPALRALCIAAVTEAGLTPVGELFHRFVDGPGSAPASSKWFTPFNVEEPT